MTRIVSALADISDAYEVLFCDLWGCLHNGRKPFPAAVAALQGFRGRGGQVVLLTNSPRPSKEVIAQIDRMGVPRDAWDLVTSSGDAAQTAMLTGAVGHRVWHVGAEKDLGFFDDLPPGWTGAPVERVPLAEAEGIVCTGPYDDLTEVPDDYRDRFLHARARGLKLLCANPDIIVDYGDRRIYCAGALAALYTEMGGEALYYGKPHPPIYDLALSRLTEANGRQTDRAAILAVGDGIGTDIAGAFGEDIDALFVTGGIAAPAFGADHDHPDPAKLASWLEEQGYAPAFAIGRLG